MLDDVDQTITGKRTDFLGKLFNYGRWKGGSQGIAIGCKNHVVGKTYTKLSTVPKTPQQFSYDDDWNMTSDGIWTYTWNGENRLVAAEKSDAKLEFKYDYMGRRVEKKVYSGSTGNWTLSSEKKFVYDGYQQIAEFDGNDGLQKKLSVKRRRTSGDNRCRSNYNLLFYH